jgi:hypothetical protein
MLFTRGDVRGPYRFIQNRSRVSVLALKSDAAAKKPKDQLSRDFVGRPIFDFCNNISQTRKWPRSNGTSLLPSRADVVRLPRQVRKVPTTDVTNSLPSLPAKARKLLKRTFPDKQILV